MKKIAERFLKNPDFTKEEFQELLSCSGDPETREMLAAEAVRIRKYHYGDQVYIRGLIEFTNYCKNDCYYCGIRSGRDIDKFAEMKLTKSPASIVSAPLIAESPVNLECKVFDVLSLGSHDMFLADVVAVHVDDDIMTDGKIDYAKAKLVNYQHGEYYATGRHLGRFGYAAQRKFIAKYGKGLDVDPSKVKSLTRRKKSK